MLLGLIDSPIIKKLIEPTMTGTNQVSDKLPEIVPVHTEAVYGRRLKFNSVTRKPKTDQKQGTEPAKQTTLQFGQKKAPSGKQSSKPSGKASATVKPTPQSFPALAPTVDFRVLEFE